LAINKTTKILLGRKVKRLFLGARIHLFLEPFSESISKVAYLSRLSQWCADQGIPEWNDRNDTEWRHDKRYDLYAHVMKTEDLDREIDFLEFGVGQGFSFDWWVEHNTHPSSRFVGFDTFVGLPENWGYLSKGAYSSEGKFPARSDNRCSFEVGLFQDTLYRFLETFKSERKTVVHMDADLYSSTLFVLTRIASVLKPGDILFFDEFGVPTHEFRAFTDVVLAYRLKYALLGAVNNYMQIAIKIL
jgi:O-methyltransferase